MEQKIGEVEAALEEGDLDQARNLIDELKHMQKGLTRDTARLEAATNNLETLAHAGDYIDEALDHPGTGGPTKPASCRKTCKQRSLDADAALMKT